MARHRTHRARGPKQGSNAPGPAKDLIYGTHAAEAALGNERRIIKAVYATENAMKRLHSAIEARGIGVEVKTPREMDKLTGPEARHQGIAVEADPLEALNLADLAEAKLVIVLDQVTDPHNVGAVLRSAAVFGADALVMTSRNSPPLSGTLAKAASGGLEHVDVVHVPNLARALAQLATFGFTRIGLDGNADQTLEMAKPSPPLALVLGAEGKGLRRLTAENCDHLCRLSTVGPLASLNISNAAAVALHIVSAS